MTIKEAFNTIRIWPKTFSDLQRIQEKRKLASSYIEAVSIIEKDVGTINNFKDFLISLDEKSQTNSISPELVSFGNFVVHSLIIRKYIVDKNLKTDRLIDSSMVRDSVDAIYPIFDADTNTKSIVFPCLYPHPTPDYAVISEALEQFIATVDHRKKSMQDERITKNVLTNLIDNGLTLAPPRGRTTL